MFHTISFKPALIAALAMATGAFVAGAATGNNKGASPQAQNDLRHLAQSDLAEIDLGHLALQKSTNPVVQKFAHRMIEDHSALLERVRTVARDQNVSLPATPDAAQTAQYKRLQALSGKNFDDAYIRYMLEDHQKDIKMLPHEEGMVHDAAVYNLMKHTEPILENHIRAAEHAAGELGLSARSGFNQPVHPSGANPNLNKAPNVGAQSMLPNQNQPNNQGQQPAPDANGR